MGKARTRKRRGHRSKKNSIIRYSNKSVRKYSKKISRRSNRISSKKRKQRGGSSTGGVKPTYYAATGTSEEEIATLKAKAAAEKEATAAAEANSFSSLFPHISSNLPDPSKANRHMRTVRAQEGVAFTDVWPLMVEELEHIDGNLARIPMLNTLIKENQEKLDKAKDYNKKIQAATREAQAATSEAQEAATQNQQKLEAAEQRCSEEKAQLHSDNYKEKAAYDMKTKQLNSQIAKLKEANRPTPAGDEALQRPSEGAGVTQLEDNNVDLTSHGWPDKQYPNSRIKINATARGTVESAAESDIIITRMATQVQQAKGILLSGSKAEKTIPFNFSDLTEVTINISNSTLVLKLNKKIEKHSHFTIKFQEAADFPEEGERTTVVGGRPITGSPIEQAVEIFQAAQKNQLLTGTDGTLKIV